MSGDVVARAKAALDATACPDEMQEFFRVGFVRELVAEVEKLRGALETIRDKAGEGVRERVCQSFHSVSN